MTDFIWPKSCNAIPGDCFDSSGIKTIQDIEDVSYVGAGAFAHSAIEEITWPKNCTEIPSSCFYRSSLKKFPQIDNISTIGLMAFCGIKPTTKIDMSNSSILSIEFAAFAEIDKENIIFPYYMSEEEVKTALKF